MAASKRIATIFRMVDATFLGLLNLVRFLTRFLPPQTFLAAADYIGYAVYYIRPGARKYILETMRESLPDVGDERELVHIAKKAFSAPIKSMLDIILMERHLGTVMDRFIVNEEAIALYDRETAAGRGGLALAPPIGGGGVFFSLAWRVGR